LPSEEERKKKNFRMCYGKQQFSGIKKNGEVNREIM
jgi:hypothetical protein